MKAQFTPSHLFVFQFSGKNTRFVNKILEKPTLEPFFYLLRQRFQNQLDFPSAFFAKNSYGTMLSGEVPELQFRKSHFLLGAFNNSYIIYDILFQSNPQSRIVCFVLRVSLVAECSNSESFKTSTSIEYKRKRSVS